MHEAALVGMRLQMGFTCMLNTASVDGVAAMKAQHECRDNCNAQKQQLELLMYYRGIALNVPPRGWGGVGGGQLLAFK